MDLLGFGFTEKPAGVTYDPHLWKDQVVDFVNTLVPEACILLGNSIGSQVSLWSEPAAKLLLPWCTLLQPLRLDLFECLSSPCHHTITGQCASIPKTGLVPWHLWTCASHFGDLWKSWCSWRFTVCLLLLEGLEHRLLSLRFSLRDFWKALSPGESDTLHFALSFGLQVNICFVHIGLQHHSHSACWGLSLLLVLLACGLSSCADDAFQDHKYHVTWECNLVVPLSSLQSWASKPKGQHQT